MMNLTQLSPAESLLLISPKEATTPHLALLTFWDLVMRKILKTETVPEQEDASGFVSEEHELVSRGPHFEHYLSEKHEAIFLEHFENDPELEVSLRNLIKMAFEKVGSLGNYKTQYVIGDRLEPYFSANFFQRIFGKKKLNAEGEALQMKLRNQLDTIRSEVKTSDGYSDALMENLMSINGNLLLLEKVDKELFDELTKRRKSRASTRDEDIYDGDYDYDLLGWPSFVYWMHPDSPDDDIFDVFEDTFDDMDSSDSGDGGDSDSGDSGCSGCGGCGGCD